MDELQTRSNSFETCRQCYLGLADYVPMVKVHLRNKHIDIAIGLMIFFDLVLWYAGRK